MKNCHGDIM